MNATVLDKSAEKPKTFANGGRKPPRKPVETDFGDCDDDFEDAYDDDYVWEALGVENPFRKEDK